MNFNEFLFLNSEIEHNVRAIVRLQMLKGKLENQIGESKNTLIGNIDKKIQINKELIQQYLKRSYITISYEDIEGNILKLVQQLLNEYDVTKSFKENYSKSLSEFEKVNVKDENKVVEEIENIEKDIEQGNEGDLRVDIEDGFDDEEEGKAKIKYVIENDKYYLEESSEFAEIPMKIYEYDLDKIKQIYGDDYDDIFKGVDIKRIKYHDPRLVLFLWQKMGKEVANEYLTEFAKGKKADKSKLSYEITYDMKKISNNKTLSKKERKMLVKMAKKNENVAILEQDNKKILGRVLAGVAAGIFGIGASLGLLTQKEETKSLKMGNKIEKENAEESSKENEPSKFSDKYKVPSEDIEKELDDVLSAEVKGLEIKSEQAQKLLKEFKLGDTLYLQEGINYSENSMGGGRKGETGVTPWRPAGDYEVNGVSILDVENNILTFSVEQKGLNVVEYIKKNLPENGRVAFHISKLQDGDSRPTGWVESDKILEALAKKVLESEIER